MMQSICFSHWMSYPLLDILAPPLSRLSVDVDFASIRCKSDDIMSGMSVLTNQE